MDDLFVLRLNVERFRRVLATENDDATRRTVTRLLEGAEATLRAREAEEREDTAAASDSGVRQG